MKDPFGSMNNMIAQMRQFGSNRAQFMNRCGLNIPPEYQNDANVAIQYLMNTGQLTQQQYNAANSLARQIQNNPICQRLFGFGFRR